MTEKDNGGRAFPSLTDDDGVFEWGMTLRDYFAGQALIGITTKMDAATRKRYQTGHADGRDAAAAYALADAMLEARKK